MNREVIDRLRKGVCPNCGRYPVKKIDTYPLHCQTCGLRYRIVKNKLNGGVTYEQNGGVTYEQEGES